MRALLDVNVLLALLDIDHVFHRAAHRWWATAKRDGWASCPITENGVVRIMSQASYAAPDQYSVAEVVSWLKDFASKTDHVFWADDISLLDERCFEPGRLFGPKQLTDVYLLGLAASKGGCLATFDQKITAAPVPGASNKNIFMIT